MSDEKEYIQGFNAGYILQQYRPELVTQICTTVEPTAEYTDGFLSGSKEYEKEQLAELSKLRARAQGLNNDLEK